MLDHSHIEKLIGISTGALGPSVDAHDVQTQAPSLWVAKQLAAVLAVCNGFYAFEGALHLRPLRSSGDETGIAEWNEPALWKHEYGQMADGLLFFAEDAFGYQFAVAEDGVFSFDPETGRRELMQSSMEAWAEAILSDYQFMTGHPLAAEWQTANGKLPVGRRLVPRIPFVCGGAFAVDNLDSTDAVEGMRARGNIARQIQSLPDGARVTFKVEE